MTQIYLHAVNCILFKLIFNDHFIQQYFTPEAMLPPVLNEQEQALLGVAALEFFQSEKSHVGSSDGNASVGGGALASDLYLNRKNYYQLFSFCFYYIS